MIYEHNNSLNNNTTKKNLSKKMNSLLNHESNNRITTINNYMTLKPQTVKIILNGRKIFVYL